jgi:CRP/FNR family transcriptional regulator
VEGAGGTLGEVPLFESMHDPGDDPQRVTRYPATAVAAEPTRCLVLSREVVRGAVRSDPDVALALLARLAGRVRHLVERMDRRAGMSTLRRLATLLLARHRAGRGGAFVLGRTQEEAAEELGTVRELVVRGLRTLRRAGVVRALGRGRYVVSDEAALERIAHGRGAR